jgi:flagellar biosynthetic protein FliO
MSTAGHQLKWMRAGLALAALLVCDAAAATGGDAALTTATAPTAQEYRAQDSTSSSSPAAAPTPESMDGNTDLDPEEQVTARPSAWEGSYFLIMAKLGLGLGLVVLLAWGSVALLRRTGIGRQCGAAGATIRVFERAYLGPRKQVCLVEIGDRTLALGVTEQQITPLTEWRAGEFQAPPPAETAASFARQFRRMLDRDGTSGQQNEGESS